MSLAVYSAAAAADSAAALSAFTVSVWGVCTQEAQAVAWVLLRCRGSHRDAALQQLRELLLFQLSLPQQQQQQQQHQQHQQQQHIWGVPTLREAASLAAALLHCGVLDGRLLQQLWRGVCRGLREGSPCGALPEGGPPEGPPPVLSPRALRSLAAGAPAGSVAVDGRRLAQAAAATQIRDRDFWVSLCRLLERIQRYD